MLGGGHHTGPSSQVPGHLQTVWPQADPWPLPGLALKSHHQPPCSPSAGLALSANSRAMRKQSLGP